MDPICISSAAVLRCTSLTNGQHIAIIIPVALEFLASCLLMMFKWGSGKQYLLLVAEGWIYFILTLLELLSVTPALSRDNVNRFRPFDIGIGIASFLPLVLYTLYLYLFTRRELLTNLPKYVINVAKVSMFLSLPMVIATNVVASVTRITITFDFTGKIPSFSFSNKHDEWLWLFFTALTLAVLTAYQATVFSFSFFRLISILVRRHQGNHDTRVRGIGWVSAGVKLGTLEAIVGFAGGAFEVSMTRRVIRFIGRTCLCIGTIMGVDPVAEATRRLYDNLERTERADVKFHRSRPPPVISNPRTSTFQELSPMASRFHSVLRKGVKQVSSPTTAGFKTPHYLTFTQRQREIQSEKGGLRDTSQFLGVPGSTSDQRVTVFYDVQGGPPLLQMRLSALDVPLVADIVCTPTKEQGEEVTMSPKRHSSSRDPSPFDTNDVLLTPKPPFAQTRKSRSSAGSSASFTPSVVEIIDVPRRTISQRRAEARVILARTGDQVEKQESKDTTFNIVIPESDFEESADSRLHRPPTPGPLVSMSRFSHDEISRGAHRRTATQSVSVKSVADSLKAVQELASQFPPLPPSASFDHSLDFVKPALEGGIGKSNHFRGPFIRAIGSLSDLKAASDLDHSSQLSQGETVGHAIRPDSSCTSRGQADAAPASRLCKEDIIWQSRQEHERSQTPSSGYSIVTIKLVPPVNQDMAAVTTARQEGSPQPLALDNSASVSNPEVQISEWRDDSLDEGVHEPMPHSLDDGRDNSVRRDSLSSPDHLNNVPTNPSIYPATRKEYGPNLKPIVIPRRRSNLPDVVQCRDDDLNE